MIIERLAIEDFKQFSKKLVIDNLTAGLNIFTGNNETGKSTVVEAVRTLFLERHKNSTLKDSILPRSKASGHPCIEAAFTHNDKTYLLRKQFVAQMRCDLSIGTAKLDGEAAEQHLAELFGFARAQKGALKADQAGVPGLLWVQQGDSHRVAERAAPAAEYLRTALGQLSGGEVVGGEDVLIQNVEKQLSLLRTKARRDATGELEKVQLAIEALTAQRLAWQKQQSELEADLNALTALQALQDKDELEKPWAELEKKAAAARVKLTEVSAAKTKLDTMRQELKLSSVLLASLLDKAQAQEALEKSLSADKDSLLVAAKAAAEAEFTYGGALSAMTAAQTESDDAIAAEALANAAATAAERKAHLAFLQDEVVRLTKTLSQAETAYTSLQEASSTRAKLEIDPKKLSKLKTVTAELVPLHARLEAASTRMEYRLNSPATLDGVPLTGTGTLVLDTTKTLTLADASELTIVPSLSDRQSLITQISKYETDETTLLHSLGVASLVAAETQLEHWKTANAQVLSHQELLAVFAPDGLDVLRTVVTESKSREDKSHELLDALPDTSGALPLPQASANAKKAAAQLESARSAQTKAAEKRSITKHTVQTLAAAVTLKEAGVLDPSFVQGRIQTSDNLFKEDNRHTLLKEALDSAEVTFESLTLIDPQAEVSRFETSARIAREKQDARDRQIIDLRARLQTAGGSGVDENLARSAAELELLETRQQELVTRADALSLLVDMLIEERNRAVQQLQSPLTKRLEHYLKWLFPQSAMTLAENLSPFTLGRAEQFEALTSLSYGTQEQLGILARLAYADLLKEAGRPTVLFFDDAAVHTDALRRDAIKQALLDAATRHQIFLFTCHPENWNDLGVEQRGLEELKAAA